VIASMNRSKNQCIVIRLVRLAGIFSFRAGRGKGGDGKTDRHFKAAAPKYCFCGNLLSDHPEYEEAHIMKAPSEESGNQHTSEKSKRSDNEYQKNCKFDIRPERTSLGVNGILRRSAHILCERPSSPIPACFWHDLLRKQEA